MRDIKFRVWDKKNNGYSMPFKGCSTVYNLNYYENNKHVCYPEQYIGREDEYSVSIYEGDILEFDFYQESRGYGFPAKWIKLRGSVAYSEEELRYELDLLPEYEKDGYVCLFFNVQKMRNFNIIGNIHQNKDLLK